MSALAQLNIRDLRPRLSVKPNPKGFPVSRRPRNGPPRGVVGHYNGPTIPWLPNPAREVDFIVTVDVPNHQQRIGGDSLMYHFAIPSDGQIWQTRNIEYIAWHAAHPEANEYYIAVHLPLGEGQRPTSVQWASFLSLCAALEEDYGFSRKRVTGHQEWSKTACPGLLMPMIKDYREAALVADQLAVVSTPRMSRELFIDVLTTAQSPAAVRAGELFDICASEGVDPAVALAFFQHESTYGKAGICAELDLHNWGMVRSPEDPALGLIVATKLGSFARYPSWQDGVLDWCRRIKGPKYAGGGLHTVETIIPKYAPSSDGNAPASYIRAVRAAVAGWQGGTAQPNVTQWRCANPQNVNIRQAPRTTWAATGREVPTAGSVAFGQVIEVDLVKTDGDAETIRGDNRWLHLANGSGFVWAANFVKL